MAVITPSYVYTDGAVLNVSGHNGNIYSETSGISLLGEANGNLNINNFDAAFEVRDYLIRPEEAVRVRSDYARDSIDYFSEAESGADATTATAREELVNVAGCGLRFWIPYASTIIWNMGFFVNIFRLHRGSNSDPAELTNDEYGEVRLQLSVGVAGAAPSVVQESKRGLPVSARLDTTSSALSVWEELSSFYIDLHHTSRVSGPGWCDIHLRMLLREPEDAPARNIARSYPKDNGGGARTLTIAHTLHNRVSFGVRHPVALVLKNS